VLELEYIISASALPTHPISLHHSIVATKKN